MDFLPITSDEGAISASAAIRTGLSAKGALYRPAELPIFNPDDFTPDIDLASLATHILAPFFAGDALEPHLNAICETAFNFPAPLTQPDGALDTLYALELFHGPTGAFKDFGARFLMGCLNALASPGEILTVLAATSGDTGGAVGCAGEGQPHVQTVILYPDGRVSDFQARQLSCWRTPARTYRVHGDFDACQALVKAAFNDPAAKARFHLTSANSINIARLLPQTVYWARAALAAYHRHGVKPGFIIPTGNLGNSVAAHYARAMGFPIGEIHIATNANTTLKDWSEGAPFTPRASLATLANAMDVGAPNNFPRLEALEGETRVPVTRVDDETIKTALAREYQETGYIWCPHGATGIEAYRQLSAAQKDGVWIIGATAHAYKFSDVVEPVLQTRIDPSPALAAVLERSAHAAPLEPRLEALLDALEGEFV